jgi:hypothetical protein
MNDQHQQSNFERTVTREAAPCSDAAKRTLTAGNSGSRPAAEFGDCPERLKAANTRAMAVPK